MVDTPVDKQSPENTEAQHYVFGNPLLMAHVQLPFEWDLFRFFHSLPLANFKTLHKIFMSLSLKLSTFTGTEISAYFVRLYDFEER